MDLSTERHDCSSRGGSHSGWLTVAEKPGRGSRRMVTGGGRYAGRGLIRLDG
jgi:hypothetical protein